MGGPSWRAPWSAPPGATENSLIPGNLRGEHWFPPKCFQYRSKSWSFCLNAAIVAAFLIPFAAFASPPGQAIINQAQIDYVNAAGLPVTIISNSAGVVTTPAPSFATIDVTRIVGAGNGSFQETVGPSACLQGGAFITLADPVLIGGGTVDPALTHDVSTTGTYNIGEPVFVRLTDSDQNVDAAVTNYAVVSVVHDASGDTETIQLTETGMDTGIFAGYLPTASGAPLAGDCVLQATPDTAVRVTYSDPVDPTDSTQDTATLDPVSRVFDSRTGASIDGAMIAIVDATTGLPATVYGNDGVSQFPSTITSGATETDSSGASYVFGPGEYRFPVIPAGDYRIVVTPPTDYIAPSSIAIPNLQLLPGAPYALGPASFSNAFTHAGPTSADFDLPVDPRAEALFLQMTSSTSIAAPGDFVRYELTVENNSAFGVAANVRIVDQLPPGVRFVSGSVSRDSVSDPDPVISPDATTLEFIIGDMATGEQAIISYVVEIAAGGKGDQLVNNATATADGGLVSNPAEALLQLTEDLFRSTGTLIGRVVEGDCSQTMFAEDTGIPGIRIYTEEGRFAVSDEGGRFHFEGLKPGTHVAQVDLESVPEYLELTGCDTSLQFAGSNDSQFFRMRRGGLMRADFYARRKRPADGQVAIELHAVATDSAAEVAYVVNLQGDGEVQIENLNLMMLLPNGVSYAPGSLTIDGTGTADPRLVGQSVSIEIDRPLGDWSSEFRFAGRIADGVSGDLTTRAIAKFDSPAASAQQTPVAEISMTREPAASKNEGYVLKLQFGELSADLSPDAVSELATLSASWQGVSDIQVMAVGHTDSGEISAADGARFADHNTLSRARAMAAATILAKSLQVLPANILIDGRGPDDPISSNDTSDGRQENRRVEVLLSGTRMMRPASLQMIKARSGVMVAETRGLVPGPGDDRALKKQAGASVADAGLPSSQVEPPINELTAGMDILLPTKNFHPAIPATKISIKHGLRQTVDVTLNGRPVNPLNFDGRSTDDARSVAVARYTGVDLQDGANVIRVEVSNADGSVAGILERTIYYSGTAVRGEIVPEMSQLVADGNTRPVVAVRLFDRMGYPARTGAVGAFRVHAPYRSWWEVEDERKNQIVAVGRREPTYRIGDDGIALIELEPTTQAGEAKLTLTFDNTRQQELRTWLKAEARDWILVGFAEGTVGFNMLTDNLSAAADAGVEDGYFDDGRVAFFAKGEIKGEYLLTLAFDSDRGRGEDRSRFDTEVDPNAYYGLYADTSEQRFDAPSQRKLYVKLERNQFFALFGDFDSDLSVTDLARYQRRFNGLKSEFRGDNVGYTAFATDTNQAFMRDELRGDGTSGLYRLSSAPLIANSEQVRIEVRDRFDTGQVISSTPLTRFLDYNLDVLDGTLYFKQPVPSRDPAFNPIFIVVEYESESDANDDLIVGGRFALRDSRDRLEVGVSYINEGMQGAEASLTGADLRWQFNPETLIKAEIAGSSHTVAGVEYDGSAHSASLEHQGETVDVRAYIEQVDQEFGLGHQNLAQKGMRKVGVDGRAQIAENWFVDGEANWQQNLETETVRNIARAQVRYENGGFTASSKLTHAADDFSDGTNAASDILELAAGQEFGDLAVRTSGNFTLSGSAGNADFPTGYVVGADYRLMDGIDLFAEYEDSSGAQIDAAMARVGVRASPWSRSQINTAITSQQTEFGPRLFSNVGLVQGFQLNEHWVLDFGLDQTSTMTDAGLRQFDPDRELVSGSLNDDFLAIYTGAAYAAKTWSANSRIELRNSDTEDRMTLISGWYREPSMGHGLSAGLALFSSKDVNGTDTSSADFKFGWAWRKADSPWTFLSRTDLIAADKRANGASAEDRRLVNNFNANRRIGTDTQMSLQYAFKYVKSAFDAQEYSGYTDLIGVDLRRAFRPGWDWGAHTSIYHAYTSKVLDHGFGLDVGYNVRDNIWLTLGYNIAGFTDSDFTAAGYTATGPYLQISIKADQQLLKTIAGRIR